MFVFGVFLLGWFSKQKAWVMVGTEPPQPLKAVGAPMGRPSTHLPEPGSLKEPWNPVVQELFPHYREEETEAQRGPGPSTRSHS